LTDAEIVEKTELLTQVSQLLHHHFVSFVHQPLESRHSCS
uniref:Protozoan/cyanobacterial globin family protein n=1 Tax=Anisakis simplex TaxID=6269 RepID=A0A0M3KBJ2_ANISI